MNTQEQEDALNLCKVAREMMEHIGETERDLPSWNEFNRYVSVAIAKVQRHSEVLCHWEHNTEHDRFDTGCDDCCVLWKTEHICGKTIDWGRAKKENKWQGQK